MSLTEIHRLCSIVDASANALEREVVRSSDTLTARTAEVSERISALTNEGRMLQTCLDTVSLSVRQVRAIQGEQIAELTTEVARLTNLLAGVRPRADHLEEMHRSLEAEQARLNSPAGKQERANIHGGKLSSQRANEISEAAIRAAADRNRFVDRGPNDWNSR